MTARNGTAHWTGGAAVSAAALLLNQSAIEPKTLQWSFADHGVPLNIDPTGTIATSFSSGDVLGRGNNAYTGKLYFEFQTSNTNTVFVGFANSIAPTNQIIGWGGDGNSVGVRGLDGTRYHGTSQSDGTFSAGDRIALAFDTVNFIFWWKDLTAAGAWNPSGDPNLGTGGFTSVQNAVFTASGFPGPYYPAFSVSLNPGDNATAFFGVNVTGPVPTGFTAISDPGSGAQVTASASVVKAPSSAAVSAATIIAVAAAQRMAALAAPTGTATVNAQANLREQGLVAMTASAQMLESFTQLATTIISAGTTLTASGTIVKSTSSAALTAFASLSVDAFPAQFASASLVANATMIEQWTQLASAALSTSTTTAAIGIESMVAAAHTASQAALSASAQDVFLVSEGAQASVSATAVELLAGRTVIGGAVGVICNATIKPQQNPLISSSAMRVAAIELQASSSTLAAIASLRADSIRQVPASASVISRATLAATLAVRAATTSPMSSRAALSTVLAQTAIASGAAPASAALYVTPRLLRVTGAAVAPGAALSVTAVVVVPPVVTLSAKDSQVWGMVASDGMVWNIAAFESLVWGMTAEDA